ALESLCRCTRNHFQLGDLRQSRQNFVLNAFAEIRVLRIAAEIFKRQHRDRFCRQLVASRTGGISARVASDEKQTDRDRGSKYHNKNPSVLSWLSRRGRKIDIFCAFDSFRRK